MTEEYTKILTKFDISPTAAKTYVALLELGKTSADKLAKRVGTYKANVYDALERLIERGLASYVIEGKKKFYFATRPEKLFSTLEDTKQRAIEEYDEMKKDIEKIMPKLSASYESIKEKNIFEIYQGKKGYRTMILDILREKPKYWKGFGNLQVYEFFPQNFQKWFKSIPFMLFSTKSKQMLERLENAKKMTEIKTIWLPQELYMPIVWVLFGDNLLIIIYEPDIIALRIKSEQIVKTFANQFDYLWKKHKKEIN
ncbi:hypothetical protein HY988_07035 [Candidatus Micrarchaeota archaeon]|nr:hypothetical protein [Candidatus Micrarchaeota archaeon]